MKNENIVIIGSGPAGMAAAVYGARAFLKPLVVAGTPSGGQLMLTSEVENYPGFLSIGGQELMGKMREHAQKFGARFSDKNVRRIETGKNSIILELSDGEKVGAHSVLIATGASAKWLGIPTEKAFIGKGVSACATCDGFFFRNKNVAVVGGGDVAMGDALTLTKFASKVYLIHRRNEFRASKIMQERVMKNKKIEIFFETEVTEIQGKERVEGIKLGGANPPQKELKVGGLFVAIGHSPNTSFLAGSGVKVDERGYIEIAGWSLWKRAQGLVVKDIGGDYYYGTSIKGIFAAGDVVDHVYRQASTAVGMGVGALLEIERYLEEKSASF